MKEISIVRENLMNEPGYAPYCGNPKLCDWPRMKWFGEFGTDQFVCPHCGFVTTFPDDFISRYKAKWNK